MCAKYIVTGGAGFIGSHISKKLCELNNEVTILDNLATGYEKNIPDGSKFIRMDISKEEQFSKIPFGEYDAVLHLAAQSSGETSSYKPTVDILTNTLGTLNMLKWCEKNKVNRFIFSSSVSVYGNVDNLPIKETDSCEPLSFYGITKLAAEHYIKHFYRQGMNTTIFRLFSVYGPGQDLTNMQQGMASIYLSYILKNEVLWVKGSKERFRDFVYIDDVVDAWLKAIHDPNSYGKTYNVASGKKTTVEQLVNKELDACGVGRDYPVKYEGSTPADQFGMYGDITKIKEQLGWKPKVKLEDGLSKMVAWAHQEVNK